MYSQDINKAQTHQNVMELLVEEEIERQLEHYCERVKTDLNRVEVATHALNRLPPLYASSEKGRERQRQIARQRHAQQIRQAVKSALAAVEKNPLRDSVAIVSENEAKWQEVEVALEELQKLLEDRKLLDKSSSPLAWENLVAAIQRAINRATWLGANPSNPRVEGNSPEDDDISWR
jgi:hypothetical protein